MTRYLKRLAVLFLFTASTQAIGAAELLILHTNDWHGTMRPTPALWLSKENPPTLGGPQALAGALAHFKTQALRRGIRWLQVDAGDRFQGTMEANFSGGMAMTDLYNVLAYTAVALGNHDFDYGKEALFSSTRPARFPLVCANLSGPGLPWRPFVISRVGSLKIGITSVITAELPTLTYPEHLAGIRLTSPTEAAGRTAAELRKRGCDLVILLSHCGHDVDRELARAVPDFDVIVGGHTDDNLAEPVRIGKTLIVQTRGYGSHMGALTISRDDVSGAISSWSYDLVALDPASWPSSPQVDSVVASWGAMVEKIASRPSGHSPRQFLRRPGPDGVSELGIQLCRAISARSGCPIVVFQLGGLRTDLPSGDLTFKDIYQILPFNHQILVGKIAGRDLVPLLDKGTDKKSVDLCIYGAEVARAAGSFAATVGGKPIRPDAMYPIALNDFLAKGGDGFEEFTRVEGIHPVGGIIRDAFLDWIEQGNLGK